MSEKKKIESLYPVMTAYPWSSIIAFGKSLTGPEEGPHYFIPLFKTKEQATAWAGSNEVVCQYSVIQKKEK